jgi:hypothetical protein
MKKATFNLGSVIQAILFYNQRFSESSESSARRSTDLKLPPERSAIFEQYYESLLWSTLGRFGRCASPDHLITLMETVLLQVGQEDSWPLSSGEEIFKYLMDRVSEAVELDLSK